MVAEARRLGLGVLIDIVPNHVGIATPRDNPWWWDLLENGRDSAHAEAFDIDWDAGAAAGSGSRSSATTTGTPPRDGSPTSRSSTTSSATTTTGFPIAPRTARDGEDAQRRPRPPALPARALEGRRRRPQLPPLLRRQHPGRRPGRGPATCSPTPTSRSGAGSTRASSTGCGSTTPTACATRSGYLDDLATMTGGAYVLVEKILEPGERPADDLGDGRHHRVRRARADRPGADRPRGPGAARRPRDPAARRPGRLAPSSSTTPSAR